jgi:formate dehydrogenase alpha subunit
MRVTVDGRTVEVAEGATLLDASRAAGADVPTLCWDERLSPAGACRLCLVAVEGRERLVASCTTPAQDGDAILTGEARVEAEARGVLELLVSHVPARALELGAQRSELVAVCEQLGVGAESFAAEPSSSGVDHSHPYVKLDRDLCIACGRCVRICDEVQGTFALELAGRGYDTVVAPGSGGDWAASDCVACGGCVDTCPTGALSEPGFLDPRPVDSVTRTTCGYCGVGCTLDVHVRDGAIAAIKPARDAPVNRGHACVKGRFAHGFAGSRDRLTRPLVRRDGTLQETSWEDAISVAADALRRIRDEHGPDAIGAISSARATNEENYLVQKLMRTVIGTNNVDNCSRLCHAPSAAGLTQSFGLSGGTNCFDDLDRADCFLLAGANATEAHPVVGARIKQRVIEGSALVVVDPRRIELAGYADVHLQLRPGANVAVFNALAHVLLEEGLVDEQFIAARTEGFDELRTVLAEHSPERMEEITGVPAELVRRAARIYGEAQTPAIVYGLGITEHAHGTDGVRALANLAILTGNVGTPSCAGVNPLRGQNNVQGASDVGALPDLLPGYQRVTDDEARARVAAVWGTELPPQPGLRILDMFDAALAGDLKALWVIGEDIAQTDPDTTRVEAALEACEIVISQEIFLSRTAERADVVLPAASFLEKDGTFVNFDRRFQRVRPAVASPGEARSDFEIIALLAERIGSDLGCPTPAAAFDELALTAPHFAGVSHARLDADGPLHWPCPDSGHPGEPVLYRERFATPSGLARLAASPYLPPGEQADGAFPLILVTGRRLEHYNSGTMTRRTDNLLLDPEERIELHPDDARRLGVEDGSAVTVSSHHGEIIVTAAVTERSAPGQAFMAFHFPGALANRLTSDSRDETTSCPEYKVTAVRVRPAAGASETAPLAPLA